MKHCPACNAEVEESNAFCPYCGHKFTADNEPVPFEAQNPFAAPNVAPVSAAAAPAAVNAEGQNPAAVEAVRKLYASPLMLALCILSSLAFVCAIVGSWSNIFNFITILSLISVWMIYTAARKPHSFQTSGFKLARTTTTIWYVLSMIAIVFVLIACLIVVSVIPAALDSVEVDPTVDAEFVAGISALLIGFCIVFLIVAIAGIVLMVCLKKGLNKHFDGLFGFLNGSPMNPSRAAGIMVIVFGALAAVSAIGTCITVATQIPMLIEFLENIVAEAEDPGLINELIASLSSYNTFAAVMSVIASILSAAATVTTGIVLLRASELRA